eukprot:650160-Prymnesium_polylepis.1
MARLRLDPSTAPVEVARARAHGRRARAPVVRKPVESQPPVEGALDSRAHGVSDARCERPRCAERAGIIVHEAKLILLEAILHGLCGQLGPSARHASQRSEARGAQGSSRHGVAAVAATASLPASVARHREEVDTRTRRGDEPRHRHHHRVEARRALVHPHVRQADLGAGYRLGHCRRHGRVLVG